MTEPRTPPALSNATPRCPTCGSSRKNAYGQVMYGSEGVQQHGAGTWPSKCRDDWHKPAAPPVADGPAATPRQQAVSSWGFSEHLIVLPDESQVAQRAEVPEHNSATSDEVAPAKHYAAAEVRAAAPREQADQFVMSIIEVEEYDNDIEQLQYLLQNGHLRDWLSARIAEQLHVYAADLQRQLDEGRRERDEYLETAQSAQQSFQNATEAYESAEAANQELRQFAGIMRTQLREWAVRHSEDYALKKQTERLVRELDDAALLGPQHGDTK